jgi:hypothetical protein
VNLVVSFDGIDDAAAAAAIEWIRLLPVLAHGELESCDLGADRATRRIRMQPRLRGELTDRLFQRLSFWAARGGGRADTTSSPHGQRRQAELSSSEIVVRQGRAPEWWPASRNGDRSAYGRRGQRRCPLR